MKLLLPVLLSLSLAAVPLLAADDNANPDASKREDIASFANLAAAQPKLLHITATVDGTGRLVFNHRSVRYKHKEWDPISNVIFDGEPWQDLSHTPPGWKDVAKHLDLSRAWIVQRQGRDVIALEQTLDGFDLYLCDSPNGSAQYDVVIAIPRR